MSAEAFWPAVLARLEAGTSVFVALVAANARGSPGTVGARLLVDASGETLGTIGGGIMEANIVKAARAGLRAGTDEPPMLERLEHRTKPGTEHPSGLICAGEQTNLNLWLQPARDTETIRTFCAALADQDGDAETLEIDVAGVRVTRARAEGADTRLTRDAEQWRYREPSLNPQRLAIVGGGHCGKALAALAVSVGYHVDVFDNRPAMLEGAIWPETAHRHALADYAQLSQHLRHPQLTAVVVMTTAMTDDVQALTAIAVLELRWLGVMGSAAKIHEIRTQLAQRGIPQARIDAIHGPIGLPMKSDTPAEIAVSIVAQLLTNRRNARR